MMKEIDNNIEFKNAPNALPCPFCGSDKIVTYKYKHPAGIRYAIMCIECVATIDPGWIQHPNVVIGFWNKRKKATQKVNKNNSEEKQNKEIRKCRNCPNLAHENYGQAFCESAFKTWYANKLDRLPYVGENSKCMFGYKEEVKA